jgi:hypothetical protein
MKKHRDLARKKKAVKADPALFAATTVEDVFGSLPYAGRAKTIDELNALPRRLTGQINAAVDAL